MCIHILKNTLLNLPIYNASKHSVVQLKHWDEHSFTTSLTLLKGTFILHLELSRL